jgi:hypothetical protein
VPQRRKLKAMPAEFESEGKMLVADFRADQKFQHFYINLTSTAAKVLNSCEEESVNKSTQ